MMGGGAGRGVTPPVAGKPAVDDDDAGVAGTGGSSAGASGAAGAAGAAGSGAMQQGPIDYTKRGPYMVTRMLNEAMGTISGGTRASIPSGHNNDPSAFTLYFPANPQAGDRFPILTFGNGTFCSPTFYDELIGHVASFGYVVIAPNTSSTGSGEEMLKGVEWVLAQDMQTGSPLFQKVNREQIGAFGHSQGGAGTCRAGADARVKTVVPLSGTTAPANIKGPAFFVTTGGEAMSSSGIENAFNSAKGPAAYGVTMSGNHDEYTDAEDDPMVSGLTSEDAKQSRAAVAAWFDWQLKNRSANKDLFVGDNCGFCKNSTWKTIKTKGF
ncbi:MAG TPA: hypothetical protein VJV78_33635 [Polyangiales bacterium]|nr:hypothetical protein [Polyangiales bacterium]